MKLFELFEKDNSGDIKSRDPKVIQTIKRARAKYQGQADDDLGALVSMMGDEQKIQDKELNTLDVYNSDQDVEIDDNERVNNDQEAELNSLRDRINKMQNRPVREENDTRSFDDWVELVILTGSQNKEELMRVVMDADEDTALHMYLKDIAHEAGVPEHMRDKVAYNAANRIPIPDAATNQQLHQSEFTEESKPETTSQNPLVVIWDNEQGPGMLGHMNLSTAAKIVGFEPTPGLAAELGRLGTHRRIQAGGKWLEYSVHNSKYFETVEEEIVPYTPDNGNHPESDLKWIDDETGELFTDNEHDEMNKPVKQMGGLDPEALSSFGDIAGGGGDPIDYLITTMGYDIEDINAEARTQGYADAHEWANSYTALEDIKRLTKTINR